MKGSIKGMKGMVLEEVYKILKNEKDKMNVTEIYNILSKNSEYEITIHRLRQILAWDHLRYGISQSADKNSADRICYYYSANPR